MWNHIFDFAKKWNHIFRFAEKVKSHICFLCKWLIGLLLRATSEERGSRPSKYVTSCNRPRGRSPPPWHYSWVLETHGVALIRHSDWTGRRSFAAKWGAGVLPQNGFSLTRYKFVKEYFLSRGIIKEWNSDYIVLGMKTNFLKNSTYPSKPSGP